MYPNAKDLPVTRRTSILETLKEYASKYDGGRYTVYLAEQDWATLDFKQTPYGVSITMDEVTDLFQPSGMLSFVFMTSRPDDLLVEKLFEQLFNDAAVIAHGLVHLTTANDSLLWHVNLKDAKIVEISDVQQRLCGALLIVPVKY